MKSFLSYKSRKNGLLKEEYKKKKSESNFSMKDDIYAAINICSFDLSLKCLNENYKRKNNSKS
ncbi:MAG: hypothetical protein WC635_04000 [Bacteriovorax sp.]|jgi:hypothetical protein